MNNEICRNILFLNNTENYCETNQYMFGSIPIQKATILNF